MRDFLTRVAERALGVGHSIAPRLPAPFAPMAEPPQAPVGALAAPAGVAVASGEPRSPRLRAVAPPAATPAATRRDAPASAQADRTLDSPPSGSPVEPPPTPARQAAENRRGAETIVERRGPATTAATAAAPATPGRGESPAATAMPLLVPPRHAEAGAIEPQPVAPPRDAPAAAAPPAPSIRISIGRVEVRAQVSAPPAAPPRRTRPPASLSLGDYLRGDGARRR